MHEKQYICLASASQARQKMTPAYLPSIQLTNMPQRVEFCQFEEMSISTFVFWYKNLLLLNSRRVHVSCILETRRLYAFVSLFYFVTNIPARDEFFCVNLTLFQLALSYLCTRTFCF